MTAGPENPGARAEEEAIVRVRNLAMHFRVGGGLFRAPDVVRAVDGVSLDLVRGETLGLVGESGCGKSTLGRCIARLYRPTSGEILVSHDARGAAVDIAKLRESELRPMRRWMQMIFQDPFASLNPRMTVGSIIAEPIRIHGLRAAGRSEAERVAELMQMCGLDPSFVRRYPHEFSGGQCQRIGIARALAAEPRLLLCDEPVSALDVSIRAQVLNLLARLRRELGLSTLFIAHDLAAVRHVSDRIAVMYLGRVAEVAPAEQLCANPFHPYSKALISAVPVADPQRERARQRILLRGELPSPRRPPPGCRFHTRCPAAWERCRREVPPLAPVGTGHFAACHLATEPAGGGA